jgi:hypothetical protein
MYVHPPAHTYSRSPYFCLSPLTPTLSYSLPHTHSLSLPHTWMNARMYTRSLTLPATLHPHYAHPRTPTHTLSLSLALSLSLLLTCSPLTRSRVHSSSRCITRSPTDRGAFACSSVSASRPTANSPAARNTVVVRRVLSAPPNSPTLALIRATLGLTPSAHSLPMLVLVRVHVGTCSHASGGQWSGC